MLCLRLWLWVGCVVCLWVSFHCLMLRFEQRQSPRGSLFRKWKLPHYFQVIDMSFMCSERCEMKWLDLCWKCLRKQSVKALAHKSTETKSTSKSLVQAIKSITMKSAPCMEWRKYLCRYFVSRAFQNECERFHLKSKRFWSFQVHRK